MGKVEMLQKQKNNVTDKDEVWYEIWVDGKRYVQHYLSKQYLIPIADNKYETEIQELEVK